jgi:trehalose-6-phosphatase
MEKEMIVYDFSEITDVLNAPEIRMAKVETREEASADAKPTLAELVATLQEQHKDIPIKILPNGEVVIDAEWANTEIDQLEAAVSRLKEERDDLTRIFELQRKRERPWIERWRKETGKHDSVPGYGATLQWICDKADAAEAALVRAERIAKEASLIIGDDRHDDEGCRFVGAGGEDGGQDGVTCFACLAQDELAKIRVEKLTTSAGKDERREVAGGPDGVLNA